MEDSRQIRTVRDLHTLRNATPLFGAVPYRCVSLALGSLSDDENDYAQTLINECCEAGSRENMIPMTLISAFAGVFLVGLVHSGHACEVMARVAASAGGLALITVGIKHVRCRLRLRRIVEGLIQYAAGRENGANGLLSY